MYLTTLSPANALSRAYFKQSVKREQIDTFKSNLKKFFFRISRNESEEHLKNIVSDFLKDTYYKDSYEINTKGRKDLVIHNGKTSSDTVGVMIEVKKPSNQAEMLSKQRLDTKALYELVHYYFDERKHNKDIRYIAATNIYEWYVFDAADFEKVFYENKSLHKDYENWSQGVLADKTTEWLYKEIIKPFVKNDPSELRCVYFNLSDYEDIIKKKDKQADEKLIDLYKIFSPEYLLKKPFANDSNTLNKEFYNELLHIIGLEEEREKSRKLIRRKQQKARDDASLLENTMNILSVRNKAGITEQDSYSIALELCITWLNRILFLKLLECQIIRYRNGSPASAFLNAKTIRDFSELDELFFEVLAVPAADRAASVREKFGNIPYLNSSLFEISEAESRSIQISALKDRLQLSLFSQTVLKDSMGKRISGRKNTLHYLFEFLDAYDFSSESGADIQEENKTIINASVLGLIFEKINGYKDGAFFTPGFVTMYMCRETIHRAVIGKFNAYYGWNCSDMKDIYNKIDDLHQANLIIDSLKICDPAVGSGHFLVSALNEMIAVKSELGILADQNGKRLRDYYARVENDELIIYREDGLFRYNFRDPESRRVQETVFHEKQKIIENCLFGVDINPKSVLICRLRLWIELLKNTYYKAPDFEELETFPNIDINIKCGNSLISRFDHGESAILATERPRVMELVGRYKENVQIYRRITDRKSKDSIRSQIDLLKQEFQQFSIITDKEYQKIVRLKSELAQTDLPFTREEVETWKKQTYELREEIEKLEIGYKETLKTTYGKAFEWRFEFPEILDNEGNFIGFDVVIGNPPYGISFTEQEKQYFKEKYDSAKTINGQQKGSYDSFVLFIEKGLKILTLKAHLHYIVPISITSGDSMTGIHHFLERHCEKIDISSYAVRPKPVFENAVVNTSILYCYKTDTSCNSILSTKMYRKNNDFSSEYIMKNLQFIDVKDYKLQGRYPKISLQIEKDILDKIFAQTKTIKDLISKDGEAVYYRTTGGRYYKVITNYSTGSTKEKAIFFEKKYRNFIGAVLSSNLFFWFYQIFSNNLDLKSYEIESFGIPTANSDTKIIRKIEKAYNEYLSDIEKNLNVRQTSAYANIDSFKEYKINKSKHLIDKIDHLICPLYGMSMDEINFIINYDIEFRTNHED